MIRLLTGTLLAALLLAPSLHAQSFWEPIPIGPGLNDVPDIAADSLGNVYALAVAGGTGSDKWSDLYRTSDHGATWTLVRGHLWSVYLWVTPDGAIFAEQFRLEGQGHRWSVVYSLDGGSNWTKVPDARLAGHEFTDRRYPVVGLRRTEPMGGPEGLTLSSSDSGRTWRRVSVPYAHWTFAIAPDGRMVAAGARYEGEPFEEKIFHSDDFGASWQVIADSFVVASLSFTADGAILAGSDDLVRGGTGTSGTLRSEDAIFRSTDRGATWQKTYYGIQTDYMVRMNDGKLLAFGYDWDPSPTRIRLRSDDDGSTWSVDEVSDPVEAITFSPTGPNYGIRVDTRDLYRSDNGFGDWSFVADLPNNAIANVVPGSDGFLYAGTLGNGVYRSARSSGVPAAGETADGLLLEGSTPHPAYGTVSVAFTLPVPGDAALTLYDILGRRVAAPLDARLEAGRHTVRFDAAGLASGAYTWVLSAGGRSRASVMVVR